MSKPDNFMRRFHPQVGDHGLDGIVQFTTTHTCKGGMCKKLGLTPFQQTVTSEWLDSEDDVIDKFEGIVLDVLDQLFERAVSLSSYPTLLSLILRRILA